MYRKKMGKKIKKILLSVLAFAMVAGVINPTTNVYAVEEKSSNDKNVLSTSETDSDDEVTSYEEFLACLKELEVYAEEYAGSHAGEDKIELVINYVRTGVERYSDGSWAILAGEEIEEFTKFVTEKDAENGTDVADIKNLVDFKLPNGDLVDLGHMFGCMNVTYYMAKTNPSAALVYADLSGWGGDIADLMEGTIEHMEYADVETMTKDMRYYLGNDSEEDYGFGLIDIMGDLDGFYIMNSLSGGKTISTVAANYFNNYLSLERRASFFVKTRFGGCNSKAELRQLVYEAYSGNTMLIETLEPSKHLTSQYHDQAKIDNLRKAACYAFADFLFESCGAVSDYESNKLYSVFSNTTSTLAPGVTQNVKYAYTANDEQMVYYLATADTTRNDVDVYANYKDNDPSTWGMARVSDQMKAAIKNHTDPKDPRYIENYNPVVGVNADFYNMTTGAPSGALVMEGKVYNTANNKNFFAVLKDGTPIIGGSSLWTKYQNEITEAVGGSIWLVQDGKIKTASSGSYYDQRYSRTCVGVTADNKVVLMVIDGLQEPYSVGGTEADMAQIMYDAGCVNAICLDGGGSATFVSKGEGSDDLAVVNSPSDGYERSVSSSLMIVSTTKPSNEFDHALVTSDSDYLTVNTKVNVDVSGVSVSGGSADLPKGYTLKLTNEKVGTLKNGVFTALSTGTTDIQVVVDGTVVGKKTLRVVVPDSITFDKDTLNVVYGIKAELPISARYNGNSVAINEKDVVLVLSNTNAGTLDGFSFTGKESSGIRSVVVSAFLPDEYDKYLEQQGKEDASEEVAIEKSDINLYLYNEGEAVFDFDEATDGTRTFAWKRTLANTNTKDDITYYIANYDEDVVGSYTFGIDMTQIDIPSKLTDLIQYLPGGDVPDATAWDFLLQLAERVHVLTEVEVKIQIDSNFELDYSQLTVVNEYFMLTSKEFDEKTNTLTIKFNWIEQTAPIDPVTANSICILSGIKVTPKEGTDEILEPVMSGTVKYDIYLQANAVYDMAQDPAVQEEYGLYPFVDPYGEKNGGHYADTFFEFKDTFVLDRQGKEGWVKESDGQVYYYKNNTALTGVHKLEGYLEEGKEYYYSFNDKGVMTGKYTGLFEEEGKLYYSALGELKTGWRTVKQNGKDNFYYFDTKTGAAVDGKQTIDGYKYTFTDHVLTKGEVVKDSKGSRYMWAGQWSSQEWLNIDGKTAYTGQNGYFYTGLRNVYDVNGDWVWMMFGNDGYVVNKSGVYDYEANGNTYLLDKGYVVEYPGLVQIDGYYYYFNSSNIAIKNQKYYTTKTNGLLPAKQYTFDEYGRMVIDGKPNPKPDTSVRGSILRIFGEDRYETAFDVADVLKDNLEIDKFKTVIITTGDNYADALSGSYLASKYDAPILLTNPDYLNAVTKYVKENVVEGGKVYILGGENAVPASLESKLGNYSITRLAGETRYDTNLAILKEAGVKNKDILICTGEGYADAVSASATGTPILLVHPEGLSDAQKEFLASNTANKYYIIGGQVAINKDIEAKIKEYGSTERIGGETRYQTSVMIAREFFSNPESAVIAYAENFPDALSGGPLAMNMDAPLILSQTGQEQDAAAYMKEHEIYNGVVLGGTGLISDASAIKIFGISSNSTIIVK